jgi:prepilin-type N-terminal cleavage/methylation domain-containing protein
MRAITGRGSGREAVNGRRLATLGFTLLEMVTVMAIIAIATAVAVPAIGSLSKSSSRRAALSLTLGVLDQTRALAISRSGNYYLAFADNSPDWPEDYRCRAFAIFEEAFSPSASPGSQYHWLQVSNWTKLPVGVAFDPAAATVFGGAARKTFYFSPLGKEISAAYFKFNSVGAVDEPADSALASVKIFEGFINSNGQPTYTNKAAAAEEVVKVSLVTGRAKREEP